MDGYICLYRKMLDWEWFKEPLTAHLFTCLLLMANQEEGWHSLNAGQVKTSVRKLVKCSGLSLKEVRKRLERLQESGEIEVACTNHNSIITIVNFKYYQYVGEICEGTEKGTQKGTQKNAAKRSVASSKNEVKGKKGTQKGTEKGTPQGTQYNQYIYIDNNIENIKDNNIENKKKKKEKETESENTKNAAPTAKELEAMFETFRKAYKGTKRGFKVEFDNLKKKHQSDWREVIPKLMPALENMEAWRAQQQQAGKFVPPYAMLQTWLNQQRWTTEYELTSKGNGEDNGGYAPDNSGTVNGYVPNYEEEF